MKEQDIQHIINKLNRAKIIFLKLIKANDVGATGAHQAGFHLPKSSWRLFFDSPGVKGYKTRSHTDNFGENNVKCLIAKGICRFVPHSSAGGF